MIRAYTWPDSCPALPPSNRNNGAPQCELVSPLPKVRIEIADTGSGISQADQEKIFDRFYRVENAVHTEQGTGLGLSLIHISEPTRRTPISYAVFCLKKKKNSASKD